MKKLIPFILIFLASCTTTNYYVVRHAEKAGQGAGMSSDVPLSEAGLQRAKALEAKLHAVNIKKIYSTNTIRTTSTAKPLSDLTKVRIELYDARDTGFINRLKALNKKNILIVGHSNTVDDVVNGLMGEKVLSDLADPEYGDVFIVKKKGKNLKFIKERFGQ